MTKPSKRSLAKNNTCKWCDKHFVSERTLLTHMCVKKRRWADREMTHVRLGFRVFQMFYEQTSASKTPKTEEDFIRSQYYEGFVKFGRSCVMNEYLQPERFAEWLIKNGKKLADWTKDKLYDEFLLDYVKKETGLRALERTILYLVEWSETESKPWSEYFREVSTARAVHDIRSSKISPWVLYCSDGGKELLMRFNDEQIKMINHIIDANFWMKVFSNNTAEVDAVQETCREAGL